MVTVVVHSLLIQEIHPLMPSGALELLYYSSSYYAQRGGLSYYGAPCGVFCVNASNGAAHYSWNYGAALLCFILYSSWW